MSLVWGLVVVAAQLVADVPDPAVPPDTEVGAEVDVELGVRIPMRDGTALHAALYRPHIAPGALAKKLDVIFTLSPYNADGGHARAVAFARSGFAFALVDTRGRGGSAGTFRPFLNEGRDGADVVEWLARQPWCTGKVGMWGGSYAGFDQWAALGEAPPHLATIVPAAAAYPGVDFPAEDNIYGVYVAQWLALLEGAAPRSELFGDDAFWLPKVRAAARGHVPFRSLDDVLLGASSATYQAWMAHDHLDAWWDEQAPAEAGLKSAHVPILTITGAYDADQLGALTHYRRHLALAAPEARLQHYLVIGPWNHAGTRSPARSFGGLTFGEQSVVDMNALHRDWYRFAFGEGPRPVFLEKRVRYYVAGDGAEQWRSADSLEDIQAKSAHWTLAAATASGSALDLLHAGALGDARGAAPSVAWVADPLDDAPLENDVGDDARQDVDLRPALHLHHQGAVFTTDELPRAVEMIGEPVLHAWVSVDVKDTDLRAYLWELSPDGGAVLLGDDVIVRGRWRDSRRTPALLVPGKASRWDFRFPWFARRLQKGTRVVLVVSSVRSLGVEQNMNSGGTVGDETRADARTAHVTLWLDAAHPSALDVPLVSVP